ncbi:MAG: histidinol phosphate phosphatase [Microthrixaceae bacterium]|jgi:histidinol-phosphatase|nr:histidinol phosphate phosphatase [Microthrixaceae bacterium]
MSAPIDLALLDTAVALLRQAGELTLEYFRHPDLAIDSKGDGTPVTVADRAAERMLREELESRFPEDGILGEEEAEKIGTSGRRWIIDPIDGTKAFTHGVPLYTNLLALEDGNGIALGVINVPALAETVYAGRGLGCFCNGERVSVNQHPTVAGSYLTSSGLSPWSDDELLRAKHAGYNLRTWGDGYGYVLVATGRVEAMYDPKAELYDVAPMPVILAEAGGRFTAIDGSPSPDRGSGLATNGLIHDETLAILRGEK